MLFWIFPESCLFISLLRGLLTISKNVSNGVGKVLVRVVVV
jgi:hypothetical protein